MDTLEVLTLPLAVYVLSTSVLNSFSLGFWINEKAATPLNDIQTEGGAFVTYILADTLEYRKRFNHKAVKKPSQYLNGSMRPQLLQALISSKYCKMP